MNEQNTKDRITLEMRLQDAIVAIVEGNPGALSVIMKLLGIDKEKKPTETEIMANFALYLLRLDTERIYGSHIWLAYKDVCGQDIDKLKKKIINGTIKDDIENLPYVRKQENLAGK